MNVYKIKSSNILTLKIINSNSLIDKNNELYELEEAEFYKKYDELNEDEKNEVSGLMWMFGEKGFEDGNNF